MRRKTYSHKLFFVLGTATVMALSGCTDNDYDFNEVDTAIGIGGDELEIPSISTELIPLRDVLELEDNGSVVEDSVTHDYVFRQEGADVSPVNPSIDKIIVSKQALNKHDVELTFNSAVAASIRATSELTADGWLQAFTYEGMQPEEVIDLNTAEIQSKIDLTIDFNDVKSIINTFDFIEISLPAFMTLSNVECGNQQFEQQGSKLIFNNVPTQQNLKITTQVTELNFKESDDTYGTLKLEGGKIKMDGQVYIKAAASDLNTTAGVPESKKISSTMEMDDFTVEAATGKFNPDISLNDLGDINVNGIPDFLQGGNVRVDLYNPQIKLTMGSNMSVPGKLDGTIKAVKDGKEIASVYIPDIPIDANKTSTICICRREEGVDKDHFDHVIVNEGLSKLIETIPDNITFSAVASADTTKDYRFELGHEYEIIPAYTIDAPIAFSENANIEYRETLDGWSSDIEDFDLSDDAYINFDANIKSCVPAYLTVTAQPIDVKGNELSKDEITIDVTGSVMASKDGKTEVASPVNIKISQKKRGALKKLDGVVFVVAGAANDSNGAVTGITLNAEKHTLKVEQIKIKLVGKLIANL